MNVLCLAFDTEELTIRLASELAAEHDVTLMLDRRRAEPFLKWLGHGVDYRPFELPRIRQMMKQFGLMFRLIRDIKQLDPDLIHMQKWHFWFFLSLPFLSDYPLLIAAHDPIRHTGDRNSAKTPAWLVRFGYRRADRLIAHNKEMASLLASDLNYPPDRIDVVPLLERGDASLAEDVAQATREILFFGRIWPYKGLIYLIQAAEALRNRFPDLKVVIAGSGESLDRYRSAMRHPEMFEIHNRFLPELEVAQLFKRSTVVILPYVEATQSAVIPTAYTFGRPVVATRVGGLASQVEHGKTGLLVEPRNSEQLAEAITALLEQPEVAQAMGRAGNAKLRTEWSAEAVAAQTSNVYSRVVRQGGRRS